MLNLSVMSVEELKAAFVTAKKDLDKASDRSEGYDEDWHSACFAGFYVLCEEMRKRGLSITKYFDHGN